MAGKWGEGWAESAQPSFRLGDVFPKVIRKGRFRNLLCLIKMMEPWPETQRKLMDLWVEEAAAKEGGAPKGNQNARKEKQPKGPLGCSKPNNQSAEGILARLKRDHPEIAQAFIEGEYPSAAAFTSAGDGEGCALFPLVEFVRTCRTSDSAHPKCLATCRWLAGKQKHPRHRAAGAFVGAG